MFREYSFRPALSGTWLAAMLAAGLLAAGLLLGLIGPVGAGQADPGTFGPGHLTTCVAAQRPGDTAAKMLDDPARFDCRRPQHEWGPGSFWIRIGLPAGHSVAAARWDSSPRMLRFVPSWHRSLAVFTRDADGHVAAQWFDSADLSRHIGVGGILTIPLEGPDRPVTEVLLRIDGAMNASGMIGDPRVIDTATARIDELVTVAALAAFLGLSFGLFCYNIVLWLTIRERFQLTYCLSLLAMMAYVWVNSAILVQFHPGVPHTVRLGVSYVMLGFVGALALQFIVDFLEADKLPARLRRIARQIGPCCVLAGLAVALAPAEWRHLADRIYVASFVPLPVMVVALTMIAWRRGSRSVRVLVVAWVIPVAMALVRIAHGLNLIAFGPLVQYSLIIGMGLEALLSSLAMSYRIKLITEERDRARADERAARKLANVDSLTGLLNRRALLEQLVAWRSEEPLRLLLVDIDRFKLVNDRHGHLVGDEVLRSVAEVLAIRADLNATVARLGGEEFALVGAARDLSQGVALGILADIRSRPMADGVRVTVSLGMAEGLVRSDDEWRELYRRADAALYRAKSEGRNRAVHEPSGIPVARAAEVA